MARVTVSRNITHAACRRSAGQLAADWETGLTRLGSQGHFRIEHGDDLPCEQVHDAAFNAGMWIVTGPRGCKVFVTRRGRPSDYIGAGRVSLAQYRGPGHCGCGGDH